MPELSVRLSALAAQVPEGWSVADVGCDHGLLSVALAQRNHAVVASDISGPSLAKARRLASACGLSHRIQLRQGDGLTVFHPGEADAVILAGMSGQNMLHILDTAPESLCPIRRLICQPMQGAATLRYGMAIRHYAIAAEELVEENGRFFQIIVFVPGRQRRLTYDELCWGPAMLASDHPLLFNWLEREYERLKRQYIDSQSLVHRAQTRRQMERIKELQHECRRSYETIGGSGPHSIG